jgi:hypothetical protein
VKNPESPVLDPVLKLRKGKHNSGGKIGVKTIDLLRF